MEKYELRRSDIELSFKSIPDFENTRQIAGFTDMIGQDMAGRALEFGLGIDKKNANIFVCDEDGLDEVDYVVNKVREYAKNKKAPHDLCYIYNFEDEFHPISIMLPPGTACDFRDDIDEFIFGITESANKLFSSDKYKKERSAITDVYQRRITDLLDELYEKSNDMGFNVKSTSEGFAFIPLNDGKEMSEREYNDLSEKEKDDINDRVIELKQIAIDVLSNTKAIKREMNEKIKELDDSMSDLLLDSPMEEILNKYQKNDKLTKYFKNMKKDIASNIDAFLEYEDDEESIDEAFFKRYRVNVMTCNSDSGAPVIYEDTPEFHKLIGIIEYESKSGNLVTDFTMIKPGALHRANGGYIIIDALQMLMSFYGWSALKKCMKTRSIEMENLKNQYDIIPLATIRPEKVDLDVKVILIGSYEVYSYLYKYDKDFRDLFGIKVEFSSIIPSGEDNAMKITGLISSYCKESGNLPVTRRGVVELLRYSSSLAESSKYFTAKMNDILRVVDEADYIARKELKTEIEEKHIREALYEKDRRHSEYKRRMLEMYSEGKYIAKLSGSSVGQINALSVLSTGDIEIGKQNRITVATFGGKEGIINIERETDMSGNIHSKGIMILSGYLGETFGQNMPLSFNASICFEQMYGGIEGDSASAAELIAIMSSLGDIPLKQSLAITGSVNQKGEIQPIGGVNTKIRGYFDICKIFGLDGSNGVILPALNVDELVLDNEVLSSIDKGDFHLYSVKTIDECFEILCDDNYKRGKKKVFEAVKQSITDKLEKYNGIYERSRKK